MASRPNTRLALAAMLSLGAPWPSGAAQDACPPGGTSLRWDSFAQPLLRSDCVPCHDWSRYTDVYRNRSDIAFMVKAGVMPPPQGLSMDLRAALAEWIDCDLPYDGPACPSGGTWLSYATFASRFFADHCLECHSRAVVGDDRNGAPPDLNWDDYPDVVKHAAEIGERVRKALMPPNAWIPPPEIEDLLQWIACGAQEQPPAARFRRGDANGDGAVDLSDAVGILLHLFLGAAGSGCPDAEDSDRSGGLDVTDAVSLLDHLFLAGPAPPPPYPDCGSAPLLGCLSDPGCGG
jgi:hypothetical protein